jgi:hypothetical protein
MTSYEVIENKMRELVKQLDEPYHCFVIIYREADNPEDANIMTFGIGCPKCAVEVIKLIEPNIEHTGVNGLVH